VRWWRIIRPYLLTQVQPYVLKEDAERALKPKDAFKECARYCPDMVVIPAGSFIMGSPATENGYNPREGPQHDVRITRPFAVSKF
jgi:formylglycine-generating enzyme required for sulfatase activity